MGLDLSGMPELKNYLKQLDKIGESIAEKALKAGAEILRAEIERRAPRSTFNKKHLADSIIISEVIDGNIDIGPHKDFFYAWFHEFGASTMSANPFVEPAYLAVKDKIQRVMGDVIRKELARL